MKFVFPIFCERTKFNLEIPGQNIKRGIPMRKVQIDIFLTYYLID